mmetsp:Transcript_6766/g.16497  ORF Transcript_6766/g.16497 Transcript_6766/m.16497 type:complete len:197 (-) Transcript_6766:36-626(-)
MAMSRLLAVLALAACIEVSTGAAPLHAGKASGFLGLDAVITVSRNETASAGNGSTVNTSTGNQTIVDEAELAERKMEEQLSETVEKQVDRMEEQVEREIAEGDVLAAEANQTLVKAAQANANKTNETAVDSAADQVQDAKNDLANQTSQAAAAKDEYREEQEEHKEQADKYGHELEEEASGLAGGAMNVFGLHQKK